jgi:hypothetical protein
LLIMGKQELRSSSIGLRVRPRLKKGLERLAKAANRTLANYIEVTLEAHLAAAGTSANVTSERMKRPRR